MNAIVDGTTYPLDGEWSYSADLTLAELPRRPESPEGPNYSTVLYNAMLHPLKPLPVKGVLWYQGCSNVGRAEQYDPLFKSLISSWRKTFSNLEMPFYFVQLAGFQAQKNVQPESEWALLRNSQAKALELPNTGMAVAIDLGHPTDIHPSNKQEVARRLALLALNHDYGKKNIVSEAPVLLSSKVKDGKIILKFNGAVKPTSSSHRIHHRRQKRKLRLCKCPLGWRQHRSAQLAPDRETHHSPLQLGRLPRRQSVRHHRTPRSAFRHRQIRRDTYYEKIRNPT